MHPPEFWQHDGVLPALLAPAAALWSLGAARRASRRGWRAPARVICCGNATVGGAGKTTLALDLGARLRQRGEAVAFLTRGYGGRARGVHRVDPARDEAALVGDEPRLLAACAPTYVAADRAAGARAAIADGARVLVMDDGLQNPTLAKDLSFLVIDGAAGFGNGRVLPAGPLREPLGAAAARCRAAVLIGEDATGAEGQLRNSLALLRARLIPDEGLPAGCRVFAFAGIGRPEKFFAMLAEFGAEVVGRRSFPDHHVFTPAELREVLAQAERLGAVPVTTPKDAARLSPEILARVAVCGVRLAWEDEAALERMLDP